MAAAADLTENLTCCICFSLFKKPKALPCLHTYCQECIGEHMAKTQKDGSFLCPMCKNVTQVPDGGAKGLKDHFDFHTMVEKIQEIENNTRAQSGQEKPVCDAHPGEPLKIFCKSCNTLICAECSFSGHRGHSFESPKAACKAVDAEVAQQVEASQKEVQHLDSCFEEIGAAKALCGREKERLSALVSDHFETVRQAVNTKEQEVLNHIGETCKNIESDLDANLVVLDGKYQAVSDALKTAEEFLKNPCDFERMLKYKTTMDRLVKAQEQFVEIEIKKPSFPDAIKEMPEIDLDLTLSTTTSCLRSGHPSKLGASKDWAQKGSATETVDKGWEWNFSVLEKPVPKVLQNAIFLSEFHTEGHRAAECLGICYTGTKYIIADNKSRAMKIFGGFGFEGLVKNSSINCKLFFPCDVAFGQQTVYTTYNNIHGVVSYDIHNNTAKLYNKNIYSGYGRIAYDDTYDRVIVAGEEELVILDTLCCIESTVDYWDTLGEDIKPTSVAITQDGEIVIADRGNCVFILNTTGTEIVSTYKPYGHLTLKDPVGVCCDDHGHILVLDCPDDGGGSVHVVSKTGKYIRRVLTNKDGLDDPRDITICEPGTFAIIECDGAVKVYRYLE